MHATIGKNMLIQAVNLTFDHFGIHLPDASSKSTERIRLKQKTKYIFSQILDESFRMPGIDAVMLR